MTHVFIHIGDAHLSSSPRNDDRRRAVTTIVDETLERDHVAAVVWPGDLNDKRMAIEDRNFLAGQLQRLANKAPVILCPGNHDLPGDLDVFAKLAAPNPIAVINQPQVLTIETATGISAAIFVLPYPSKGALIAAGRQGDELLSAADHCLDAIFIQAAAELEAARAKGYLSLMVGHVNVGGAIASVGQPQIGKEIELTPGHLDRLGDCPKLLNHIHAHQEIHGAHYAGSICRMDWAELEEKGYQVVTFDDALNHEIEFVPIDVPKRWHVEGELTDEDFTWEVTRGPDGESIKPPASWAGAEVRVRFRFPASERSVVDEDRVRAPFADAARLALEPIAVPSEELRAPEVAAATTLEDKVRAWADLSGESLTEGTLDKLTCLQQQDATVVLTEVAQQLAKPDVAPAHQAVIA